MDCINSSNQGWTLLDFDIRCLAHRLEMARRHDDPAGTIRWDYRSPGSSGAAAVEAARSRRLRHERAADEFLRLAAASEAERLESLERERRRAEGRRGMALAVAAALGTLAFSSVVAAWTDVSAAPRLGGFESELSIAAGDPADEAAPLLPRLQFGTLAPKVIEFDPFIPAESENDLLILEDSESFMDFGLEEIDAFDDDVGPVGRSGVATQPRPRQIGAATPARTTHRSSRLSPFVAPRPDTAPPRASRPASEDTETSVEASMTFDRDELSLPMSLTRGQINVGLRGVRRLVRNCARVEPDRTVRVDLTIDGTTGRVTDARVRGYLETTTAGVCVTRALRRAQFPQFSNRALAIQAYPLVLR